MKINNHVDRYGKGKLVAWLLWLFLGGLGIHSFYLGKTWRGVAIIIVNVLFTWHSVIPVAIFLFIDAISLNRMVDNRNWEIQLEAENNVKKERWERMR